MTDSTLTLYAFETMPGFFNMSPYCTKADILMRMAGLDFTIEAPEDHTTLPKAKLPVLKHGDKLIPDSEFIRLYIQDTFGYDFTSGLSAAENALAHTLCRTLEERTTSILVMSRWMDDDGWKQTKSIFFANAPEAVANEVRARVMDNMKRRDIGSHSSDEVVTLFREDLKAVASVLDDKPYLFGDEPTYADATAFGLIACLYASPVQTWTTDIVKEFPTLIAYFNRGMEQWFPEGMKILAAQNAA